PADAATTQAMRAPQIPPRGCRQTSALQRRSSIRCDRTFPLFAGRWLFTLAEDEWRQREDVDVGAHEARVRILRLTNGRLAADVERRVDEQGASGPRVERRQDLEQSRRPISRDGLQPRRVIQVRDRRNVRARRMQSLEPRLALAAVVATPLL